MADFTVPYPVHPDPAYKFKPSEGVCASGEPVLDSSQLFDGDMCCTDCRSRMRLTDGVWVHV